MKTPFNVIIITGTSASGKSVALKQLEDLSFNCIDNLPVPYIQDVATEAALRGEQPLALSVDVRSHQDLKQLPGIIDALRKSDIKVDIYFLDADDYTSLRRYSETRRIHPLARTVEGVDLSLESCIERERQLLSPLKDLAHVIDTSDKKPSELRSYISQMVEPNARSLLLTLESFAFKNTIPSDADLVFDARCLPNPHYEPELCPLTGKDEPVARWLQQHAQVESFVQDVMNFIVKWLPSYKNDTRSYLTVAVGCTGGQHRSVYVVEQLAKRIQAIDAKACKIIVRHRAQRPH